MSEAKNEVLKDIHQKERNRQEYYNFLRKRKKPTKGSMKTISFNPIGEEESIEDYFVRCFEEFGAKPSIIR